MVTYKRIRKLNYDSTLSNYQRMAASAINETRKSNGHINQIAAVEKLQRQTNLPEDEAVEYIEIVISEAEGE